MSIYTRYSDKTNAKCMHFIIKSENFFDKCMTAWEIIRNIIKK